MKENVRIPLIFLIVSLIWIACSDLWLYSLHLEQAQQLYVSNVKGYGFMVVTAVMLYYLIRSNNKKLSMEQLNLAEQTEVNKRLFNVLDMVENYIIITDKEGRATWLNRGFENHSGYTLDEMKGFYPGEILSGPETSPEAVGLISESIRNKEHCTVEILNYKKSGEAYWVCMHLAPLMNDKSEVTGFLSIQSDITVHRILEKQLSEQNDLLRKITWMTSHDVRRPLSSILSLVDLIKTGSEAENEECLALLYRSAEELDQIIRAVNQKINALDNAGTLDRC